jgi:transposase
LAHLLRIILPGNLLINQQHVCHPNCQGGIAFLQIVPDAFGMQRLLRQDPLYGGFGRPAQGRMPRLRCLAAHMPGQQTPRPKFGGVAQFIWRRACQMEDPGTRFLGDHRSARAMIGILERGLGAHGERLIDPFPDAVASHLQHPRNTRDRFTGLMAAQDSRALYFPQRRRPQPAQLLRRKFSTCLPCLRIGGTFIGMPFDAEPLVLTEQERELQQMTQSRTLSAGLADGVAYQKIQDLLDTTAPTIVRWKRRFLQHRIAGLMEELHPGQQPSLRTPKSQAKVLSAIKEGPKDGSTHWSCRKLASKFHFSKDTV